MVILLAVMLSSGGAAAAPTAAVSAKATAATAASGATASGSGASLATGTTAASISTPIAIGALVIVGADEQNATWDCWKDVVHDNSAELSHGMPLSDLLSHKNIESTEQNLEDNELIVHNIFGEKFVLKLVFV